MLKSIVRSTKLSYRFVRRHYYRLRYIRFAIAYEKFKLRNYTDAIVSVTEGERAHGEGRVAIFVIFPQGGALDASVLRALEAMNRAKVDVLVVSNIALSPAVMDQLRPLAWRVMHRENVGFDFGAYKDAVAYLQRERPDLQRLFILNDSVFYSSVGLDEYFAGLLGEEDVIGGFENWGEGHHLQSFALSVSGHVFRSPIFQGFWKNYAPVSNRIHAIESGEKKLSDAALRSARHSHVLYSVSKLLRVLEQDTSLERVPDYIVPMQWRAILASIAPGDFVVKDRSRVLIDIVNVTSPIHSGAYLFPKYMKCPIYKKDLVYRQRYQFWELDLLLKDLLPPDEFDEFILQIRQKGDYKRLPTKMLRLYEIGVK